MTYPRNIRNRLALAKAYLKRRDCLNAFPIEIAIGITNRCNLDCKFCPRGFSRRPAGDISIELLNNLLEQIAPYVDAVDLSFDGEPFLHPQWIECIEACHRHDIRAILQTNCILLDETVTNQVLSVGVDAITFSIDAATRRTYQRLKPGGDYDRVINNVKRFLSVSEKYKKRPYTIIQFVRSQENAHEARSFVRQWKGRGADFIRIKPMYNFGGTVDSGHRPRLGKPCILLWTSLSIHWDGTVPLCCMEIEGREIMGDANREPLRELVDNEVFRAVRRMHISGNIRAHPICRSCDVPDVSLPFILGSILVDDLVRRQLVGYMQKLGFIRN